jgi:hypothetical protein
LFCPIEVDDPEAFVVVQQKFIAVSKFQFSITLRLKRTEHLPLQGFRTNHTLVMEHGHFIRNRFEVSICLANQCKLGVRLRVGLAVYRRLGLALYLRVGLAFFRHGASPGCRLAFAG